MYQQRSATSGTRRLCPGGEAESVLADGATVNATVSGHHMFPSSTAVHNLACTGAGGRIALPVCIVTRSVHVCLYLQHCINFFSF
jgi:hypothetical protein